ncbi:MAG: flagellar protein FlaG [Magnetococcales bacterium]|nr:flagellar protein FlaG [Magnetococcales bacterium]
MSQFFNLNMPPMRGGVATGLGQQQQKRQLDPDRSQNVGHPLLRHEQQVRQARKDEAVQTLSDQEKRVEEKTLPRETAAPDGKQFDQMVDEVNQTMNRFTSLQFSVDKETNGYVVSVVDKSTDEVIRQIPSANMAKVAGKLQEMEGLLFDRSV